jgi:hypothetical protein
LSWEGDEPSAAVAEEDSTPDAEESTPLPQAETVTPAIEVTLPEASIVEGKYMYRRSLPRVVVVALGKLIPCVFC